MADIRSFFVKTAQKKKSSSKITSGYSDSLPVEKNDVASDVEEEIFDTAEISKTLSTTDEPTRTIRCSPEGDRKRKAIAANITANKGGGQGGGGADAIEIINLLESDTDDDSKDRKHPVKTKAEPREHDDRAPQPRPHPRTATAATGTTTADAVDHRQPPIQDEEEKF